MVKGSYIGCIPVRGRGRKPEIQFSDIFNNIKRLIRDYKNRMSVKNKQLYKSEGTFFKISPLSRNVSRLLQYS